MEDRERKECRKTRKRKEAGIEKKAGKKGDGE